MRWEWSKRAGRWHSGMGHTVMRTPEGWHAYLPSIDRVERGHWLRKTYAKASIAARALEDIERRRQPKGDPEAMAMLDRLDPPLRDALRAGTDTPALEQLGLQSWGYTTALGDRVLALIGGPIE